MANVGIPAIVKHMTVAIYRKPGVAARTAAERFKQCLQIAKSQCQKFGLVRFEGASLTEDIALTPAGRAREMHHKIHKSSSTTLFDTLYAKFDLDGVRAAAAKQEKQQEQERQAEALARQNPKKL